jgi:hypothetical protein
MRYPKEQETEQGPGCRSVDDMGEESFLMKKISRKSFIAGLLRLAPLSALLIAGCGGEPGGSGRPRRQDHP